MAKEFAKAFYKSKAWERCRQGYIAERIRMDGGVCEVCGINPGYIVHHKARLTPDSIDNPDVALNWKNLRWECKECHDEEEGHGVKNKKAGLLVAFDSSGQPVPLPPDLQTRGSHPGTGEGD